MFLLIFVTFLLQSLYSSCFSSEDYYKDKRSRVYAHVSNRVISIDRENSVLSILDSNSADSSCLGTNSSWNNNINEFSKLKKLKKNITEYTVLCYEHKQIEPLSDEKLNPEILASAECPLNDQKTAYIRFLLKKKEQLENYSLMQINENQKFLGLNPMKLDLRAELVAACILVRAAEGFGTILTIQSMPDKEFIFRNVLPFLNPGAPVIIKNVSDLKLGFDFSDCTSLARIVLNKDEVINESVFYSVIDLLFQERTKKNHEDQQLIEDQEVIEEEDQEVIEEEDQEVIESKNLIKKFLPILQENAGVAEKKGYTIEPAIAHLFKIMAKGSYRYKHGLEGIKLALTDLDAALTDFSKDVSSTMKTTVNSSANEFKNTLKIKSKSSGWFSSATSFIVPLLKYGMIFYGTVSLLQKMMPILKKIRG